MLQTPRFSATSATGTSNAIASNLVSATVVRVYGVPQGDGSIKAYVVFYFTGTKPTS